MPPIPETITEQMSGNGAVNVVLYDRTAKRWARVRDAFPPTDGQLWGRRGGYEARLDRDALEQGVEERTMRRRRR